MKVLTHLAVLLISLAIAANCAYTPAMALQMGYMSAAAYQTSASITAWSCSYCKKYPLADPKVFQHTLSGIQGFTGYSQSLNAIIVSFRGSTNIQNWIVNLDAVRTTYSQCSGCSVHSGFFDGYNFVSSFVRSAVQALKAKYRGAKLIVTGHSLGGALGILATADLKKIFGSVDLTYTFGQPRVGNKAFAQWFQSTNPNVYRLIDYADIVPHIPPYDLGFVHSNSQIWYQKGMVSYTICVAQSPSCSNSIGVTSYSTDDHHMDNYLKLKAVEQKKSIVKQLLQKLQSLLSKKNLRDRQGQNIEWASQQQRKVNATINSLKVDQQIQTYS